MFCESFCGPKEGLLSSLVQGKIAQVVDRCIVEGFFCSSYRADLCQELRLVLLQGRWSLICRRYNPLLSSFDHFLGYCLYRECLKLRKKGWSDDFLLFGDPEEWVFSFGGGLDRLSLEPLFAELLVGLNRATLGRAKNRLLLQVHCGCLLSRCDLQAYAPQVHYRRLGYFARLFSVPYFHRSQQENLGLLLPLFSEVAGKNLSLGSLQRQQSRLLLRVRVWLNENTSYHFDHESVANLLYLVFQGG